MRRRRSLDFLRICRTYDSGRHTKSNRERNRFCSPCLRIPLPGIRLCLHDIRSSNTSRADSPFARNWAEPKKRSRIPPSFATFFSSRTTTVRHCRRRPRLQSVRRQRSLDNLRILRTYDSSRLTNSARERNHSAARVCEFPRQKYDSTFTISGRIITRSCCARLMLIELLCAPVVVAFVRARSSCCARQLLTIDRPS